MNPLDFVPEPYGVVTTTLTAPGPCDGVVAVIEVEETTVNVVCSPSKVTAVAPVKFVPVIVTEVPPAVVPVVVERLETVGALPYVNAFEIVSVP